MMGYSGKFENLLKSTLYKRVDLFKNRFPNPWIDTYLNQYLQTQQIRIKIAISKLHESAEL